MTSEFNTEHRTDMMERWWAWQFALVVLATINLSTSNGKNAEFLSDTLINNIVANPATGRLYVGAVNALYQLSPDLVVESRTETGPKRDNRQCTPPVTEACEEAVDTDNHNKLLLVHGAGDLLVVCGSVFRGICSLRNLSNVEQLIYFSDNKGEKSYVASAEESVSVVGVMSYFSKEKDNFTVFLVGKGYGSHDSTKLISTRILQAFGDWVIFDSIIEASAVQANPFVLRYLHDFRFTFKDGGFVYFLFSRTLGVQDTKNFTFISRMCEDDHGYYSYTELQLNCSSTGDYKYNKYNKAQAAYVGTPGEVLAQSMNRSDQYRPVLADDKVLFVTFTSDEDPSSSAMCMYPLRSINNQLVEIIGACYSNNGLINNTAAIYSPYSSKSEDLCNSNNQNDMAVRYKCGAEFLPSPLASKAEFALTSQPSLVRKGHMTAVAVAVEMGHAVAFLGTTTGEVLKVHLSDHPEVYGRASGDVTGDKVNKNLLFDSSLQHLYITTEKKITKVPVQACHLKTDCQSCVSMKDPYCGWCVLEGRCTRKQECDRSTEENTWLWSPNQQCVQIQAFDPPNLSCRKTQQVDITIPTLPRLRESDILSCMFGSFVTRAVVSFGSRVQVTCSLPNPVEIPPTPEQQDYVSVPVKVLVNDKIEVTSGKYHFYNCAATVRKNQNTPCIACVTSEWGCQWNAQDHSCSDRDDAADSDYIVKPQESSKCPQFESPEPLRIPVGFQIPINFQGINLEFYKSHSFAIGTDLMKHVEEEVTQVQESKFKFSGYEFSYDKQQEVNISFHIKDRVTERKIDSTLTVVLYNCSVGREDCSLCKHAAAQYQCVWCSATRSCVYRELCPSSQPAKCPDPEITDIIPRFGPLNGRISVTIKGSNMGIKKEDIRKITVAGVDCVHQEERYSVSTSVVCEIGPARRVPPFDLPVEPTYSGAVQIEVEGGGTGTSRVKFTYRDPKPVAIDPVRGPAAGGTVITINGTDLDTATKDDIAVTVGGVPCEILSFGENITCKTGRYRGQKVPSDPLTVTVKYGRNTTKDVPATYQYSENPKITDYNPKASFLCGGRRIVVTGNGFDLIQRATIKVAAYDEFSQAATSEEFVEEFLSKNDTVLQFYSPPVNTSLDTQTLRTVLHLDSMTEQLKNFDYHPDPSFDELLKNVITETSIIIVTGRGFSKAMSAIEAEAFAKRQETAVSTALPQIEEELLATPVRQVMECELAPPSSEPPHVQGEWSDRNWTRDLETEDHLNEEKQLLSQEPRYQVYEDVRSRGCEPAAPSNTGEEDVITSTCRQEQVSPCEDERGEASIEINSRVIADPSAGAEVLTGISTQSTELRSNATEIEHNRDQQSSEWEDTITGSVDKKRTVQEQVGVELSTLTEDTHRPDSEPEGAFSEGHELPSEGEPDLDPGSPTASKTDAAASESPKTNADQDTFDKMSSGYSSLSTKLTSRNLYPLEEDESQQRFHKVSLITEADGRGQDRVDSMESNGGDVDSEYMWKNRFEGVSQYRPYKVQDLIFSDSQIYTTSDTYSSTSSSSSSSAFPEATVYKHLSDTLSSTASSPAPEERFTLSNRLRDETQVYLSHESESAGEAKDEWRRSVVEREEPAAPASEGERQREGEAERESRWDSQHLPVSGFSSALHTSHIDGFTQDDDESSEFTGLFKATLVQLDGEPTAPLPTPPASPDTDSSNQLEMDNLVDTLKNMGPSFRPRCTGLRPPAPALMSSLPPIVEDAPSPITPDIPASLTSPVKKMESNGTDSLDGIFTLPPDLGLKRHPRDTRSPLELLKTQQDQQPGTRGLNLPLRASAANSIVLRRSSDSSLEDLKSPMLNGNGISPPSNTGSRLDNSIIYGSYRSSTIDQTTENEKAHRPLFRTSSLPDTGPLSDRLSMGQKDLGDLAGSRFERFSFLANSSSSSGSLTGAEDLNGRMSRPPPPSFGSPPSSNSPTRLLSPTGSIDLHRPFTTTDSALSMFGQTQGMGVGAGTAAPPLLQRSLSSDGTMGVQQTSRFNNVHGGSLFQSKEPEPERNQVSKYRAFPDAYLTKEKEHGKLNPRPGKMYIFDRPGMCGQRIEVRSDVIDATSWDLQEIISIRVVRGGWVMYEKPNFKGDKLALDEGDIELSSPFSPPEEQLQNGQKEEEGGKEQNGERSDEPTESTPARRFIIGSLRRAVRDYSVPEISLFPEENAEGKKVIFRDTSDDARIFGFPIKANSIIINAGLWLVYAQPFFQGVPRVLEVGGYSNPAAWGVEHPYVGSLHPLKVGEPRVENLSEPKLMIFEKPYFCGKSRTINSNMRDFMTRVDRQQTAFMYSVGSLKVQGGIWVGYEKDGFRGHQYLLEEGEYQDWRVWGGRDAELRSVRVIQADLTEPMMVMFEQPEEEQENMQEESTFEVTEAIPDVELFGYKTSTRSIHVLSGAWVAYSHVDYSGDQYILEKGFYNNSADWGSEDTRICSVQPILLAPSDNSRTRNQLVLYSEPDFQGKCDVFDRNQEALSEKFLTKSCRVAGGSWVLYENEKHSGNLYVLHEGDYPNLISMGCPPSCSIRSVKVVPTTFSVPSLSLFGLECLEGREITTETEIISMAGEGFNNHILSVRVNSGSWVLYEHSHYRGRQFLLEPIEITNWPKFSSLCTIGSVYPVRQKRQFFRIKNAESGHPMSVQGGVEEMKSGRVVVTAEVEPMTDIWFYQDGFIKNKLSKTMSLQVMGNIEPAAKVVLWSETRQPIQTWVTQMRGLITNLTFPGMVMDVKGGKTYDKDHVVIMPENDERPSQQWEIELL